MSARTQACIVLSHPAGINASVVRFAEGRGATMLALLLKDAGQSRGLPWREGGGGGGGGPWEGGSLGGGTGGSLVGALFNSWLSQGSTKDSLKGS